ncbi:MAG: hypothetical protein MR415_03255, partial [Coriobacteriaceae bacterium]|nr:hypothetical protein [Coriobacteriaceae bacterium]
PFMDDSTNLYMVKAAWYYYIVGYTQSDIASMLGLSRAKVVRLLDEAREQGVVQFTFRANDSSRMGLEQEFVSRFGLDGAFIVPTSLDRAATEDSIARATSMYVSSHLGDGSYLNMGYGAMMNRVMGYLSRGTCRNLSVISLTGGVNFYLQDIPPSVMSIRLNLLPCPILLSTKELRDAMVREPSITSIAKMVGLASMSVVGIGGISDNATIQKNGMLTKSDFELLRMRGSVGDILCHFIDVDGNPLDTDIESRIVSTSLSALERMSNVVAAAGGDEKVRAIRAVLRHGYVNTLITDERTARKVIEEDDRLKEMVP